MIRRVCAAVLCLAACSADSPRSDSDAANLYSLSLVGDGTLTLHPGEQRTLSVLLTREQVGPVANSRIHFELQSGAPPGTSLDRADVVTDASGVATVRFTAPAQPSDGSFELVATAPEVAADAVAFSFNVIALRAVLQIVATSATRVAPDGASARTLAGASSSVALRVREVDADTGAPVVSDLVDFTLPPAARSKWSGTPARTIGAETGAGGEAQVYLVTTQGAEGPWQVVAQSRAGESAVTFDVTVQGAGGSACDNNAQCGPGQVCMGSPPHCGDAGGDPPSGGACDPDVPACGSGQCCDPAVNVCRDLCPASCASGTHCAPGDACGAGTCVPDHASPDVTGVWLTRHEFSIRETLPTAIQDVFLGIRLIDQALLGKLTIPGLPGWLQAILNSFVSRLLQQYAPDWIQQVVHISDDLLTMLSSLRSEGSMRLARGVDGQHVKGSEVWTSLVFYWLPLCSGEIAGDPTAPPDCARIDLTTLDAQDPPWAPQCKGKSLPSISVRVAPFTAALAQAGTSWSLQVDRRQVQLRMGKVVLLLVDQLISAVTGGHFQCIEEATDCNGGNGCLVDCTGLAQDIDTATNGIVDAGTVEPLCQEGVTLAGSAVADALAHVWPVSAEVLDFAGSAAISGTADDTACRGDVAPDTCAADLQGTWSGDFFYKLLHPLPGRWSATRP